MPPDPRPTLPTNLEGELDTLSSAQVHLMISSLDRHQYLLDQAHNDSLRSRAGRPPAYVLDFELIWSYIRAGDDSYDQALELEFLLEDEGTMFVLGHGTSYEMLNHVAKRMHFDLTSKRLRLSSDWGSYFDVLSDSERESVSDSLQRLASAVRDKVALARLSGLLERTNVRPIDDLDASAWDEDVFEVARRLLRRDRPETTRNNAADAINLAQVAGLRESYGNNFCFLLTRTTVLTGSRLSTPQRGFGYLDEQDVSLARVPSTAIYSYVTRSMLGTAENVFMRTAKLSVQPAIIRAAGAHEQRLRG